MPARTGHTTYVPGKGATTTRKGGKTKTFTGKGPAPSGATKAAEPSYTEVPTVTVHPDGHVTTSGFANTGAERAARRQQRASERRVKRIVHFVTSKPQTRSLPKPPTPTKRQQLTGYEPNPVKAVISTQPNPQAKPPTFHGAKTAGSPTRAELTSAAQSGGLRKNQAGFVTTPKIRKVSHEVKQAKKVVAKAGGKGQLHSAIVTTPEQSKIAKTVLRVGEKKGANRKEKLAALATGLQESGMKNLPGGTGTSQGWRQELSTLYPEPRNVRKGAENFYSEAKTDTGGRRGRGETIPHLAQAIQASGAGESYYADNVGEAKQLLHQYNRGKASPQALKRLSEAKAKAESLGLNVGKTGPAPKKLVSRVVAAEHAMKEVEGTPYVWGGGHNSGKVNPSGGLDCSGAVSYVLQHVGVKLPGGVTSGEMGHYLKPGPGALTVFYNPEHTFLRLINKKGEAEYWGTSVGDSGAGGLTRHPTPSASYLAQYNVAHVAGMGKKQALQLGAPAGSFTGPSSFPGMTLSSSGTTATIQSGAGTTQKKPGFSKSPIQLTPMQKIKRAEVKLSKLSLAGSSEAPSTAVLNALEKKYGSAAA